MELPVEVVVRIFMFVDSMNQRKLFLVSKETNTIVDHYCFSTDIIPFVPLKEFLRPFKPIKFRVYSISYNWRRWREGLMGLAFAN